MASPPRTYSPPPLERPHTHAVDVNPALHRRILTFLNAAILPSDLEFAKPLFVHDHEGVPVEGHAHGESPTRRERIMDTADARRILALRHVEYPLGFTHLRQLTTGILDAVLETLHHHLGEHTYGEWASGAQAIPLKGPGTIQGVVHAALLRTGKVLFITADETTLVWDPEDVTAAAFQEPRNQPHSMPGGYSQLCGHHVFLSDGRLLCVGGGGYGSNPLARWGFKYDPLANTWERTSTPMSDSRWYPTAVALGDRRVLIACGHGTGEMDIYDESTDTFTHVDLDAKPFPSLYPGLHLLPNNSIFYTRTGWGTAGAGGGPFRGDDQSAFFTLTARHAGSWTAIAPAARDITDRTKGMSVMILDATRRHARVLAFGGADATTNNTYETCDASSMSAGTAWSAPIPFPDGEHRSLCSAVLLPDGNVFLSGGIQRSISPCAMFDPRTDTWSRAAELAGARDYHSMSLLLPSGKVMVAGWQNANIDIYSPPYLFNGPRPVIRSAPQIVGYGQRFDIEVPEAQDITRIVLVRPSAVTHQTDTEQRVIELSFFNARMRGQRDTLALTAPDADALHALAPPGYYMLFVLNHEGVPSVATWIRLVSMVAKPGATVTALQPFEGHVDLFVTTADGTVMSTFFEPDGGWRTWFAIHADTKLASGTTVTALQPFPGHVDLFATTGDGTVMSTFFEPDGGWRPWFPIHGEIKMKGGATVTALQPFPGHVDLFATTGDGTVMSTFFEPDGGWRPWFALHGATKMKGGATVTVLQPFEGHVDLFATTDDGTVMSTFFEPDGGWRPWFAIHAGVRVHPGAEVAPLLPFEGHVDLFATTGEGMVTSTFFEPDGGWRPWFTIS
ncbi:MAG: galactose oxidase-like domain-containing protein [Vicinamibacteraceae bacterium]